MMSVVAATATGMTAAIAMTVVAMVVVLSAGVVSVAIKVGDPPGSSRCIEFRVSAL